MGKFQEEIEDRQKTPVNAFLFFAYIIVGAEIHSLLDGAGFDPYLGFYHTVRYGRPSLALDILEEFRHSVIDRLALKLFNLSILDDNDFYQPTKGGFYLSASGKTKFFKEYERLAGKLNAENETTKKQAGFREKIKQRCYKLAKMLQNAPEKKNSPGK